jgi:hypothetical protein
MLPVTKIVADLRFVALSFLLVHRHVDRDKVKGSWIQKLVSWTQEAIRGVLEREQKSEDSKKHLACDVTIPMLFAEASSYEKHVFSNNLYETPNAINQQDENHRDTYTATSPTPVSVQTTTTSQAGRASDGHALDSHPTYQTTVELEINGDLNKMAEDWTQEEMNAKQRLVQFDRLHQNNTISATFSPSLLEVWSDKSICVSCIWSEKTAECYITSTDIMYLL